MHEGDICILLCIHAKTKQEYSQQRYRQTHCTRRSACQSLFNPTDNSLSPLPINMCFSTHFTQDRHTTVFKCFPLFHNSFLTSKPYCSHPRITKKRQNGRKIRMFCEVFSHSQAIYSNDLFAIRICWYEYHNESFVESRNEPLCPCCLSSCICHCCYRPICHHLREVSINRS